MWFKLAHTCICSTGPSDEAVNLLSSILWPLGTVRYSITFSRPPNGRPQGSRSDVGLQQSETRHVDGEHGLSISNCTEARLLGRPGPLDAGGGGGTGGGRGRSMLMMTTKPVAS